MKEIDIKPRADIVNELTVELLETFLKEAKEGTLQEVVICGVLSDESTASGYTPTMKLLTRLGALEHAKMRWYLNDVEQGVMI